MKELPIYYLFVVHRSTKAKLRYQASFVPRVGDTIAIGDLYLKVVDVVVESAQHGGVAVHHSLYVHVENAKTRLDVSDYQELELDDFTDRVK